MPLGTKFDVSVLTDEQAYDVAGYIVSHDRPKKENLDEDFPEKPIVTPYGPYADGFLRSSIHSVSLIQSGPG